MRGVPGGASPGGVGPGAAPGAAPGREDVPARAGDEVGAVDGEVDGEVDGDDGAVDGEVAGEVAVAADPPGTGADAGPPPPLRLARAVRASPACTLLGNFSTSSFHGVRARSGIAAAT